MRPARVTEEMKPARWRARAKRRLYFVLGIEVRPSLAREAFWRWERALQMEWMPILDVDEPRGEGLIWNWVGAGPRVGEGGDLVVGFWGVLVGS